MDRAEILREALDQYVENLAQAVARMDDDDERARLAARHAEADDLLDQMNTEFLQSLSQEL